MPSDSSELDPQQVNWHSSTDDGAMPICTSQGMDPVYLHENKMGVWSEFKFYMSHKWFRLLGVKSVKWIWTEYKEQNSCYRLFCLILCEICTDLESKYLGLSTEKYGNTHLSLPTFLTPPSLPIRSRSENRISLWGKKDKRRDFGERWCDLIVIKYQKARFYFWMYPTGIRGHVPPCTIPLQLEYFEGLGWRTFDCAACSKEALFMIFRICSMAISRAVWKIKFLSHGEWQYFNFFFSSQYRINKCPHVKCCVQFGFPISRRISRNRKCWEGRWWTWFEVS